MTVSRAPPSPTSPDESSFPSPTLGTAGWAGRQVSLAPLIESPFSLSAPFPHEDPRWLTGVGGGTIHLDSWAKPKKSSINYKSPPLIVLGREETEVGRGENRAGEMGSCAGSPAGCLRLTRVGRLRLAAETSRQAVKCQGQSRSKHSGCLQLFSGLVRGELKLARQI